MLLLSYTGCFTFMKWFELLRHEYKCPTVMLQIPYQGDGKITKNMRDFVVKQLKEEVIPMFEKVSGVKFDIDRLREYLKNSAAEDNLVGAREREEPSVPDRCLLRRRVLHRPGCSPPSAALPTRSSTTTWCARRSSSASARARARSRPKAT